MPKLPTGKDVKKDVKKARKQAADMLSQARTPLYAVLGAGDLATEAVRDYVAKARADAADDVQTRVVDLQTRLVELQDRLVEVRTQVRTKVGELPDVAELRGRLEPAELRAALENYVQSLQDLYEKLATRGEVAVDKLRKQPQVSKAIVTVENVADEAEGRVGKLVDDAREIADDVLGRVGRSTRSTGEKAARATQELASEVAKDVVEAGDEVAHTTRSVSRKAANRVSPPKAAAPRKTTAAPKAATPRKTGTKA